MSRQRRLAPSLSRTKTNPYIEIAQEMLEQIDYEKQYEKQEISRKVTPFSNPLKLYFLREAGYLHFSFEGFGELFGHQITLSHNGTVIASAYINHTGDATICVSQGRLPNDFRLIISPTSVG